MKAIRSHFDDSHFCGKPWPPGPWDDEPDKEQWEHEGTGLPCLIVRNRLGALCGYVGVPRGHPFYGKDFNEVHDLADISVHFGLTYSGKCNPPICHEVEPGEPDDVWWLGFDCLHMRDYAPSMLDFKLEGDEYRGWGWVTGEVNDLAEQIAGYRPTPRVWPTWIRNTIGFK